MMDECMLNDLLECSVCLERLDTSSKVLPCQHTFCKKCLEEIVSTHRELRCPECRVLVDAKVDDLPPNVLLMRILEGMRNAAPKNQAKSALPSSRSTSAGTAVPQRLFGGHQVAPAPIVTGNLAPTIGSEPAVRHSNAAAKQVHLHNQAYGRAIYDYVSKVPGDLSFKKGDIVILRKKIDNNWYFGECGNNHGVFPLSYVQVMTPLTPHVPQCKALYDFRMTNDDEDGCLTFNKGEVISVIRRVDENWAEGKLLDRIGIFPLAFVELNSVARALMKLSTNVQPGPSRVAPPTPTNEETTPLIPTDHSRNVQTTSQSRPQLVQVSDSVSNVSSGGSSTTTTPNTPNSSTTSSSSSTAPSSPGSPATSPPAVGNRHNVKRHSFTAVNTGHHAHPHHRHSAEILSPPVDSAPNNANNSGGNESFSSLQTSGGCTDHGLRHRRSGSSDLVLAQASQNIPAGQTTGASGATHLPAAYVALYPYKPQKADELELRKGGIYMVTERCQDGWFKGTSNRTQKCGVFPGNYVAPANRCQRGLCRGSPNSPSQHQGSPLSNAPSSAESRLAVTYTKSKGPAPQPYNPRTLPPPELPPRAISPSTTTVSSSWHGAAQSNQGPNQETSPPRHNDQNAAATPLGRSHSAVMTANIPSPGKQIAVSSLQPAAGINSANNGCSSATIPAPSSSTGDMNRSPNNTLRVAGGIAPSNAAATASRTAEKPKEKKDKCVSLMRRLTNIKKSKSPPPATYSMDNPVFDDGNSVNPMHVRSNESGAMVCSTVGNHHRKSNSLDAGMGKQMKQQSSRDRAGYRFRCIVPYPPNSEFELELRVGDIIYVQKKRDDGWYKGMQQRTGRTGLFPASFVEAF
ncbi:PREDICTED: SH3 domain-containing RING finger protein 3 isoform X3 [Vollenhovia emeryi]|uniref:SH3 domain-containing RING finger protein 3 isoform X3 n=1 Tax=Vollenhovia emeryi TaxID=411798 RepID=UPI0005F46507|nr:PREDICTED: SH3 domain-containing RING finger protein 3 isoform X3 [Vollenhovia emeryi]